MRFVRLEVHNGGTIEPLQHTLALRAYRGNHFSFGKMPPAIEGKFVVSLRLMMCLVSLVAGAADAVQTRPIGAVPVVLTNFKFQPAALVLRSGAPTVLALRNVSGKGHSFSAPELFASARLDPRSQALVHNGRVEVPAGTEVDVTLTPPPGRYRFKCTHTFHAMLGMTGTITVE